MAGLTTTRKLDPDRYREVTQSARKEICRTTAQANSSVLRDWQSPFCLVPVIARSSFPHRCRNAHGLTQESWQSATDPSGLRPAGGALPCRRLSARRLIAQQWTTAPERFNPIRVLNRSSAHLCTECVIGVTEIASRRCFSVPGLSLAQVSLVSKRNTLRDLVLLLPFGIAGLVTVFLSIADRLRIGTDQLAQLSFLFAKPWAWLLDFGAVPGLSHSTRGLGLYVLLLWIPAALYSAALWVVFRTVRYATSAHAGMRHFIPHKHPQ